MKQGACDLKIVLEGKKPLNGEAFLTESVDSGMESSVPNLPGPVYLLIPVLNEEEAIGKVLDAIPEGIVNEIIVCDNGSKDKTMDRAAGKGATVLLEQRKGYGSALLKGMEYLKAKPADQQPFIVAFLDGDHADHPEYLPLLLEPIYRDGCEQVIGSRVLGKAERGALSPVQFYGNRVATTLIKWIYGVKFTDLGPFRAILWEKLLEMDMEDQDYGWTVEMQVKAAKMQMRCCEIAVPYRKRIGHSKISGTISGSLKAGWKILFTIAKVALTK